MSFYNDDYDAPWNTVNERSSVNDVTDEVWNDPMHRDDPFAPWNDPVHRDDPFAPWNEPMSDKRDYEKWERQNHSGWRTRRCSR